VEACCKSPMRSLVRVPALRRGKSESNSTADAAKIRTKPNERRLITSRMGPVWARVYHRTMRSVEVQSRYLRGRVWERQLCKRSSRQARIGAAAMIVLRGYEQAAFSGHHWPADPSRDSGPWPGKRFAGWI